MKDSLEFRVDKLYNELVTLVFLLYFEVIYYLQKIQSRFMGNNLEIYFKN